MEKGPSGEGLRMGAQHGDHGRAESTLHGRRRLMAWLRAVVPESSTPWGAPWGHLTTWLPTCTDSDVLVWVGSGALRGNETPQRSGCQLRNWGPRVLQLRDSGGQ